MPPITPLSTVVLHICQQPSDNDRAMEQYSFGRLAFRSGEKGEFYGTCQLSFTSKLPGDFQR